MNIQRRYRNSKHTAQVIETDFPAVKGQYNLVEIGFAEINNNYSYQVLMTTTEAHNLANQLHRIAYAIEATMRSTNE